MQSKYKSISEWEKANPKAVEAARKRGLLKEMCELFGWESEKQIKKWTKEECIKIAHKYKTKKEFRENEPRAYDAAGRNKWMDEICKHMSFPGKYSTYESISAILKKFKINNDEIWLKLHPESYFNAKRLRIYRKIKDDFKFEDGGQSKEFWTIYENCLQEIKKFKDEGPDIFIKKRRIVYNSIKFNNWKEQLYNIVGWQNGSDNLCKPVLQLNSNKKIIKEWSSIKEANLSLKLGKDSLRKAIKNNKLYKGFFWEYKN